MSTNVKPQDQASMSDTFKAGALYAGTLWHGRVKPKRHSFKYNVFFVYANLDEVSSICQKSFLWSCKLKWWFASFYRKDFHGNPRNSLKESVQNTLQEAVGRVNSGPIYMLANWRYFGFNINPLTTYYCFDEGQENPSFIVAEVTNTPWRERKAYVLTCNSKSDKQQQWFDKELHVSPFNDLHMRYKWESTSPGKSLTIKLDNWKNENRIFSANLQLVRRPLTQKNMTRMLVLYPLMTVKTVIAIYWQAFKLWFKRTPLYNHPKTDY